MRLALDRLFLDVNEHGGHLPFAPEVQSAPASPSETPAPDLEQDEYPTAVGFSMAPEKRGETKPEEKL